MFAIERQEEILKIINTTGRISVAEIQKNFLVGYETAKRDLMILEERGEIQRTYGGAIKKDNINSTEDNLIHDVTIGKIAHKALLEINIGEKIFLDNSKYSFYIARNLSTPCHITTFNIKLACILKNKNLNVTIVGGQIDVYGNVYDEEFFNKYTATIFDKAFISGKGYETESGLSTNDEKISKILREATKISDSTICMLERQFIGKKWEYQIIDQKSITRMYTD